MQVEFGRGGSDDDAADDLTDDTDRPVDAELTDAELDDDEMERGGVPQARGGAQ